MRGLERTISRLLVVAAVFAAMLLPTREVHGRCPGFGAICGSKTDYRIWLRVALLGVGVIVAGLVWWRADRRSTIHKPRT